MQKKDIISSLIIGELTSWFLILVIKNPYIEEVKQFVALEKFVWMLPIIFPILFLFGIIVAIFLGKIIKIFYQLAKFVEVGVLNTMIDFGVLNLLSGLAGITSGLAIIPLNAASFFCATTNSYFWNKFWTFKKSGTSAGKEFMQFLVISAIGIGINTGIVFVGTSYFSPLFGLSSGAWLNFTKLLATFVSMTWNFIGYKFVVFK